MVGRPQLLPKRGRGNPGTSFTVLSSQLHYGFAGARSATSATNRLATRFPFTKQGGSGMSDQAPTRANAVSALVAPLNARWQTGCGKSALIAITAIALTGCATTHSYTPIYCVGKDQQLPAEPPKVHDKLTGKADTDIGIVAGSAIRLRAWGEGLQTILNGCREPSH